MTISTLMAASFWLISALIAGFGAFFGSYFRKKGENLAIHENISKLVDQVTAVTTATKEIEAKISSDLWDRQKQWELKREILYGAAKTINEVDDKLMALSTMWEHKVNGLIESKESESRLKNEYINGWREAMHSFDEVEALTQITCSPETMRAFGQLGALLKRLASEIVNGNELAYKLSQRERDKLFGLAKVAIRRELGIPITVTPLSSKPSPEGPDR